MNNETDVFKERKRFQKEKLKDLMLVGVLALALALFGWSISEKEQKGTAELSYTETEARVSRLISQIDGVGGAELVICETETGVQSVVVVCEGAENFTVLMNVREAVSAALGIGEEKVKIYVKN